MVTLLACRHHFHRECSGNWCAIRLGDNLPYNCPLCRAEFVVERVGTAYDVPEHVAPFQSLAASHSSISSHPSTFPIWPASPDHVQSAHPTAAQVDAMLNKVYHSTQLENGKLAVTVDPGAYTSLIGAQLARSVATKATKACEKVTQEKA